MRRRATIGTTLAAVAAAVAIGAAAAPRARADDGQKACQDNYSQHNNLRLYLRNEVAEEIQNGAPQQVIDATRFRERQEQVALDRRPVVGGDVHETSDTASCPS